MRELRLKYIINLVSDIAARTKDDEKALTSAQRRVQEALGRTGTEATRLERLIVRAMTLGARGAKDHADRLAHLALRYQDVRRAAESAATAMGKVQGLAAGAAAGAYAADRMTRAPMEYSLRLAHMANTAYADRNVAGRIAGKNVLNASIIAAIRTGGGKRDDAAGTLDALIASGAMSIEDAIKLLPALMKGSTASGATAEQLGSIALRGMQSFGIQRDQVPAALNMAMAAGQAGGFELKDMARWLPQAMAAGRMSGLSGMEGMRRIIASMQASVVTAGTKDEAGNNVVNLLAKINSNDTAKDFHKLGIDLPAHLAEQRGKGVNSLDAFVSLVDSIAGKDKEFVALKARLAGTSDEGERKATLQSMADILQGKAVGQVIQDRQALMALVAEMGGRDYVKSVMQQTRSNTGAIGTSFDVITQESDYKRQQLINEGAIRASDAFDKLAPVLGVVLDGATGMAREFPMITTAVVGATGALTVFSAALLGSGLLSLLTGRAGAAGGVIGTAATAATGAVAGASGAAAAALRGSSSLFRAAPLLAPLLAAWTTSDAEIEVLRNADRMREGYRGKGFKDSRVIGSANNGPARRAMNLSDPNALLGVPGVDLPGLAPESARGQLDIKVTVSDERVTASQAVRRQPSVIRINPGNTNPAGY